MALLFQLIVVLVILLLAQSNNSSSSDGFPLESLLTTLIQRLDAQQAQIDELKRFSSHELCLGRVEASEFQIYRAGIGIYAQVNTEHCQFRSTPTYLTSLGGMNSIWYIPGATSIYNATRTGFRVYLGSGDGIKSSEELLDYAILRGWTLNWVGLEKKITV